ncbi:MAG: hypothetical protein E5V18_02160 [Mesorhizobium sp.]|uniref:hypothetical protein n=1 Tax=Mesorhizobium sp. TaxID=1871066 RepID=UPI001219EDF3|nr:hypothetical protein [Mesorhizobium sp.]TIY09240.1 MAG: hypothetical protein E5V18_02160 [Mesorhizobium sp.]
MRLVTGFETIATTYKRLPGIFLDPGNISWRSQRHPAVEQQFPSSGRWEENSFSNHSRAGLSCIVITNSDLLERLHENKIVQK